MIKITADNSLGVLSNKTRYSVISLLIVSFIYLFRLFTINSDLPNWGVGLYQPVDEGSYAYSALDYQNYGEINITGFDNAIVPPHLRTNYFGNFLTIICMTLFGDNYLGFRLSSFIVNYFNIVLMCVIIDCLIKKNNTRILYLFASCIKILLATDFCFTLASKVVEPSIYRMQCLLICLVLFLKIKDERFKYFLIGLVATYSVIGVYITNIFLWLAFFLLCITNIKKNVDELAYFILGSFLIYAICDLIMFRIWNTEILLNTMDVITGFKNVDGYVSINGKREFIKRIVRFISANYNIYNAIIVFVVITLLPTVYNERKKELFKVSVLIVLLYMLQTIYTEDYILRKYVIISPLVVFLFVKEFAELIEGNMTKLKRKCIMGCSLIGSIVLTLALIYRFYLIGDGSYYDYCSMDRYIVCLLPIIVIMCVGVALNVCMNKTVKTVCIIFCALSINMIVNLYLDISYIYFNQTYCDEEIMKDLVNYQDESEVILGEYMVSYSLYNDIRPNAQNYEDCLAMMHQKGWYLFAYSSSWHESMKAILGDNVEIVKEYERKQKTFGEYRNLALYKLKD